MVVFGDSLSDNGNTTHLLKSLRLEESPSYLVRPVKVFVINKMNQFAEDYYVPQVILDEGIRQVVDFFDYKVAPMLANLVSKIRRLPVIPGKPYWNNRFSNGRVWVEYLAPMLNIDKEEPEHYINKAFGGSWAITYNRQLTVWNFIKHPIITLTTLINGKLIPPSLGLIVQAYLLEREHIDDEALYFIYSGNNDYLNALLFEEAYDEKIMSQYIDYVIHDLTSSIKKLSKAGARRFVVLGIPHIGNTPKFINTADMEVLNRAVDGHNDRLKNEITYLNKKHKDLKISYIDIQNFFVKAIEEPQTYGFSNITEACVDIKLPMFNIIAEETPFKNNFILQYAQAMQYQHKDFLPGERNYHQCEDPNNHLFWDEIHPSTRAHHFLAYEVCLELEAQGYATNCIKPA